MSSLLMFSVDWERVPVKNRQFAGVRNGTSQRNRSLTPDRRVQRTKTSLREALMGLAREKPYDAIAVKEILGRANVGRSTFYAHFHDKNELLESAIHEMLGSIHDRRPARGGVDEPLAFSRPILDYIAEHRRCGAAMPRDGRVVMHARLQTVLTSLIGDGLAALSGRQPTPAIPTDLIARHIAGTFVLVLNWWVETDAKLTAADVDARFRALVLPVLTALRQ
jgi:AcrR family transcriptional regulator